MKITDDPIAISITLLTAMLAEENVITAEQKDAIDKKIINLCYEAFEQELTLQELFKDESSSNR